MIVIEAYNNSVPIWERYLLTVSESAKYFNIGENKMQRIANENEDSEYRFVVMNGNRKMINRKRFEKYIDDSNSI